jgi:hypothetical protein
MKGPFNEGNKTHISVNTGVRDSTYDIGNEIIYKDKKDGFRFPMPLSASLGIRFWWPR